MMIKGKDNQENMARLYDSFQKYSQDTGFVSTLEKYQREVFAFLFFINSSNFINSEASNIFRINVAAFIRPMIG